VHGTVTMHGAAHIPDATTPPAPTRHRGTPAPIVHPIVVTRDEGHTHAMVTRRAAGVTLKPADRLNLSATTSVVISPVPTYYHSALANPYWHAVMQDEIKALIDNGTWTLVPQPASANIVSSKWAFKHKFHLDGTLSHYKARWVVRGYSQCPGVDYDYICSPVVKPATIRSVLSIAVSHAWPIHQLDVKNAFLHSHLEETVYCQ
jgi:hypothetical protein